jgi:hypothetical protein
VRLHLRLEGGDQDAVRSLADSLAGVVRAVEHAGDGLAVEAYADGVPSLLAAVNAWWRPQRRPMRLTISTGSVTVTIEATDPAALAQVVNVLVGGVSYDQYGSPPPPYPGGIGGPPGGPDFPTEP